MSRKLKAALCAAGVALTSSAADAAYVQYDFYTTGSGDFVGFRPTNQVFSFIVGDAFGDAMSAFPTPSSFESVAAGDDVYFAYAKAKVATTVNGVTGSAIFGDGTTHSFAGTVSASAVFDNVGGDVFSLKSFDVSDVTGFVSLNQEGSGSGGTYSGTVRRIVATVVPGSAPTVGFVGFASAVPESSTWAMMLVGFGMLGYSLRRRTAKVAFA